ncbi:CRISPR-associated helicase Cas3' [Actinomadura soli]|uniref:CRISPR-associated helicase Cas3 n=1 Tax=Actinomadura soli TaxID=2508997 RepID=A0A5C4J2E8_9ACTN|nr:CRISPR-associated helicase Cas3' [Actinomadura soli]TMQ90784.1 CRISPR-associated helicase Cas3' [Actinomadura soli]
MVVKDLRAKSSSTPGVPGELLTDHLLNTLEAARTIRARIGDIPGMPAEFWTWAAIAALLHDTGKLPDGFQRMIGNTPRQEPILWGERHEVLSLGFVQLLLADVPAEQREWVAAAVAGHHRPFTSGLDGPSKLPLLTQYGDDQPQDFAGKFTPADPDRLADLMKWLHATGQQYGLPFPENAPRTDVRQLTDAAHRLFQSVMDQWEWSLPAGDDRGITAVLLLGSVTMADHLSSAHAPLETRHPLDETYSTRLVERLSVQGHALRPQQRAASETIGNLLLRSWTGSGKTEAVLLWAAAQIRALAARTKGNPRVFYLLPYLASINAMTLRLGKDLNSPDGIGVAHSKAASYHLAQSLADGCAGDDAAPADTDMPGTHPADTDTADTDTADADTVDAAVKAHSRAEATKNFRELFRVGTPYQVLRGALAGPVHSSVLTDSANSIFILDELHAYDVRRLGMILAIMSFWHRLGGRIAVLSATMPTALADLVTQALDGQTALVEPLPETHAPLRHRLHIRQAHLTDEPSLDEIRERLADGRSVLVVANNVRDAISLYETLGPSCIELHGANSAHLLHSRYRRMDRTAIETAIQERFASGKPRRAGLLVGTQALEVSLDLDLDACHTSAADLEALVQRFGRANRLGALAPAPVVVHQPVYDTRRSGGDDLWADGVYEAEPTLLGWDILNRHDGQTINEQVITGWLDEIYTSPWGQKWAQRVDEHRSNFEDTFLTFSQPFDDRSELTKAFDEQFEGIEAILAEDYDDYRSALDLANTPVPAVCMPTNTSSRCLLGAWASAHTTNASKSASSTPSTTRAWVYALYTAIRNRNTNPVKFCDQC